MKIWNGINLDYWAQHQTLKPQPAPRRLFYSGIEVIDIGMHWWDYIPAIPLELRFASFGERLDKALAR